jgi:hypothetical protein
MGRLSQAFFTPRYWQEFEDLTAAVFPYVFEDPSPQKFGRSGQAQHGVDVYGDESRRAGLVGIQCKRMEELDENNDPYPGGSITRKVLRDEYQKALTFRPPLSLWVFATTAKRDARIQQYAAELSDHSKQKGSFRVKIWFWDDYLTYLNNHDDLIQTYYNTVLQLRTPHDEDLLILDMFAMAFSRPAFHTSLVREHADHWFDALKDTQRALTTGELVDRETRRVIRKVMGGWRSLNDDRLRSECGEVSRTLRDFHNKVHDAITSGALVRHNDGRLTISDYQIGLELTGLRDECLSKMSQTLTSVGMAPI